MEAAAEPADGMATDWWYRASDYDGEDIKRLSGRIRSLPMPPAFAEAVKAETEELRAALAEATAAWEAALALNENTSPFGGELMRDRIERTMERAGVATTEARALLSRLEAKGESQ